MEKLTVQNMLEKIIQYLNAKGVIASDAGELDQIECQQTVADLVELIRGFHEFVTRPAPINPAAKQAIIRGFAHLVIGIDEKGNKSLKEVGFGMELPEPGPLIERDFIDAEGLFTGVGIKALTNCFIQGLAANIKDADAFNKWKQKDHIEFIVSELAKAVTRDAVVFTGRPFSLMIYDRG